MTLRTAFAILLFLILRASHAEHLPGGSITYTCLGGNFFEVKLSLLRECSGFMMIDQTLNFMNSCGVQFPVNNIPPVLVENQSQLCEATVGNSTCFGGTLAGFELYEFTTELYLSPCDEWTIYWSICCRQTTLNVQSQPGLYIETRLNNVAAPCNSSPTFNHNGVPRVCVGQPVHFDASATNENGGRLEYSFIDARRVTGTSPLVVNSVNYVFPNHGGEPIAGMALDQYGQITFTPTSQGYIVVVVQVDEYDENNVWVGSVMRDFPFIASACGNVVPSYGSGIISSTSGGAAATGERALNLCSGNQACMSVGFTDPDAEQTLSLWTNVDQIIPGAMVETSDNLTVDICWDEVSLDPGAYYFVITVMDDACPNMGATSFVYTVEVNPSPYAGEDGSALACDLALPFALIDSLEGMPPTGGIWINPQGEAHGGFFSGSTDQPGTYTYIYTEDGCSGTANLLIEFLPADDSLCVLMDIPYEYRQPVRTYPNPSAGRFTIEGVEWNSTPLALYDVHGRMVWSGSTSAEAALVELVFPEELKNGLYMLRGMGRNGEVIVIRVMLERG